MSPSQNFNTLLSQSSPPVAEREYVPYVRIHLYKTLAWSVFARSSPLQVRALILRFDRDEMIRKLVILTLSGPRTGTLITLSPESFNELCHAPLLVKKLSGAEGTSKSRSIRLHDPDDTVFHLPLQICETYFVSILQILVVCVMSLCLRNRACTMYSWASNQKPGMSGIDAAQCKLPRLSSVLGSSSRCAPEGARMSIKYGNVEVSEGTTIPGYCVFTAYEATLTSII